MSDFKTPLLIYDDRCPLCVWYSRKFTELNLLKYEERLAWSSPLGQHWLNRIDADKARHEIPLIDQATGNATFGIDALLEILGRRWPWIKKVGRLGPINWMLRQMYSFVSYNRKVISGASSCKMGSCSPDEHLGWRGAYILLCFMLSLSILLAISLMMESFIDPELAFLLPVASLGFILIIMIATYCSVDRRVAELNGNWATILLIFGLSMLPTLVLGGRLPLLPLCLINVILAITLSLNLFYNRIEELELNKAWLLGIWYSMLGTPFVVYRLLLNW